MTNILPNITWKTTKTRIIRDREKDQWVAHSMVEFSEDGKHYKVILIHTDYGTCVSACSDYVQDLHRRGLIV